MSKPVVLSLFDYSGGWSKPYLEQGAIVVQVDVKFADDIALAVDPPRVEMKIDMAYPAARSVRIIERTLREVWGRGFHVAGVLAAPPCTDFAGSGAQWWKAKDADGRTAASVQLVLNTLAIIRHFKPKWWALENPVGRLNKCVPELEPFGPWYFQPWKYGDAYTKKTGLWGRFNRNLEINEVEPVMYERGGKRGSWMWATLGGKSEKTKELRSITPPGFAKAFAKANPV